MDVISTAMIYGGILGFCVGYVVRDAIEKLRQKK